MSTIHRQRLVRLLLFIGICTGAHAANPHPNAFSSLSITSDVLDIDPPHNTATFSGHVILHHPQIELSCATMTISYTNQSIRHAHCIDRPARFFLQTQHTHGEAQSIDYQWDTHTLLMTGHVILYRQDEKIQAQSLSFDTKTQNIAIHGNTSTHEPVQVMVPVSTIHSAYQHS